MAANPEAKVRMLDCGEAINAAFREEMRRDERVVMWGEDVITMESPTAGADLCTRGLFEEFGGDRIRDTPVVEAAIIETAIGAALAGLRPIAHVMTGGFQMGCFDPIFARLGTAYQEWKHPGPLPVVVMASVLGGAAKGADHALSPEALFMHSPGLKIVMPSTAYDTKGLLKTAIRDDFPVLFYTHREVMIGAEKEPIPEEEYLIPFGKADIKRPGDDLTIVTWSGMVLRALAAAEELAEQGISAEIVDLRTLVPMDVDAVVDSVRKTGALLIVHEAMKRAGAAGEVAMRVTEAAPEVVSAMKTPIRRLAAKNVALPTSLRIERRLVPQVADIAHAAETLVKERM
ncbi:MAG: alpha-ketoacid dehydrogenase subunit beta [Gammaproteobacteria bacterium]|nr:alpha-ketoacid dehydrogenase subunit beta [Gammaproteobacteria bacterium]MYE59507.1 alpha-ketoacid dehydrogenase subunit beta [Alphaproteobacteria bacterium]